MRIRFLETAKVYDKENVKSSPIFELQAGTEAKMVKIFMKAWKVWGEILLPDGRKGVVPEATKMLRFGLCTLTQKEVTAYSTPSVQSEIKSKYKSSDYIYVKDILIGEDGDWLLIHDLTGNEGFISADTVVSFVFPHHVALTQEKVQVFSLPSTQSEVIMELSKYDSFYMTPMSVGFTAAQWVMVEDLSGNHGFIKGDTQISYNTEIKAKVFLQFLSHINSGFAFHDENPLDRINEYKDDLVEHIKSNKDCFSVINYCGYAGADWLLQVDIVDDAMVQFIIEKSCEKSGILKGSDWYVATWALICIEKARKNSKLVPHILESAKKITTIDPYEAFVKRLAQITWDDRIVNFLISQLNLEFLHSEAKPGSIFSFQTIPGRAQYAAEALIEMRDEKGLREIVPHILEDVVQNYIYPLQMEGWCALHGENLSEYLVEGLKHENSKARLFAVKCLARIGNSKYGEALSNLSNDPDFGVRSSVKKALKTLE